MNISGVGEMGVGKIGAGDIMDMGQIIGEMGVGGTVIYCVNTRSNYSKQSLQSGPIIASHLCSSPIPEDQWS